MKKYLITKVEKDSIADEVGIEPGDFLLSVNDNVPKDILMYRFLTADETIQLAIEKGNQEVWEIDIEKEVQEDLGIGFKYATLDKMKQCQNKCIFCFVDQLPTNMRGTMYLKDDDYRLSLLHGNYITLTNLSESEIERIIKERLSPLYISVHTTNPELRKKMLNNKHADKILDIIKKLAAAEISMHGQIVLCPGVNDGLEFERTVNDLAKYWPCFKSVAVVPVGLTKHRKNLFDLKRFDKKEAVQILSQIKTIQNKISARISSRFVFAADELYIISGSDFPTLEEYEDFPQLENGVGLTRLLWAEIEKEQRFLPRETQQQIKIVIATGLSASKILYPLISSLKKVKNLSVKLSVIRNQFFGNDVNVTGLITGSDLLNELKNIKDVDYLFISSVMLKEENEKQLFLDDKTLTDVEEKLGVKIIVVKNARELFSFISCSI